MYAGNIQDSLTDFDNRSIWCTVCGIPISMTLQVKSGSPCIHVFKLLTNMIQNIKDFISPYIENIMTICVVKPSLCIRSKAIVLEFEDRVRVAVN